MYRDLLANPITYHGIRFMVLIFLVHIWNVTKILHLKRQLDIFQFWLRITRKYRICMSVFCQCNWQLEPTLYLFLYWYLQTFPMTVLLFCRGKCQSMCLLTEFQYNYIQLKEYMHTKCDTYIRLQHMHVLYLFKHNTIPIFNVCRLFIVTKLVS